MTHIGAICGVNDYYSAIYCAASFFAAKNGDLAQIVDCATFFFLRLHAEVWAAAFGRFAVANAIYCIGHTFIHRTIVADTFVHRIGFAPFRFKFSTVVHKGPIIIARAR